MAAPAAILQDYHPSAAVPRSPGPEYRARLETHTRAASRYAEVEHTVYRTKRVLIFGIIGYVVFDPTTMFFLVPLGIVLIPLVAVQMWAIRRWRRAARRCDFYAAALGRVEDRWAGQGDGGQRYMDDVHPYADDLDIFGRGSVYELLCTARTPAGCDVLAEWLKSPADARIVRERQAAVRELSGALDLREAWEVVDADSEHVDSRLSSAVAARVLPGRGTRVAAVTAGVVLAGSLLATFVDPLRWWPVLALVLLADVAVSLALRHRLRELSESMFAVGQGLSALSRFASLLRRERFDARLLREIVTPLQTGLPSAASPILWAHRSAPQEPFFVWLWLHVWPNLEDGHARLQAQAAAWFRALGQFEALSALGCYAFEHPSDAWPELVEQGPYCEARDLGHPLIPAAKCVRNDVRLDGELQLILLSGSNMSGKSTLLRSLGTNVVLALAGAPVRAGRLRLSSLSLGTAMRFRDSVHRGTSYFMAVVERLKTVTDLVAGPRPLLFLLDEMLQGTNSRDRRAGAEAIIRLLVDGGGIGIVTTHDLTLTEISDALGPLAANMHFADQVTDGRMSFDYKLKPGVVQGSNALALLRNAGLKV